MDNQAICITAGEQSLTHLGMDINGQGISQKGFSIQDLENFKQKLNTKNINSELYYLNTHIEHEVEPASLLIIRNGVEYFTSNKVKELFDELTSFEWDKKYWDQRRQKVLNKRARYNICFGNDSQEPDFENKKGTIISYQDVPILNQWKNNLKTIFGEPASNLELEGNYYFDLNKCGIGFHGDAERKKVIACSVGGSRPIQWQWYYQSQPVGNRIEFELHNGDMYIMSQKTTGFDWKKRNIYTLRHAAGKKYTNKKLNK